MYILQPKRKWLVEREQPTLCTFFVFVLPFFTIITITHYYLLSNLKQKLCK